MYNNFLSILYSYSIGNYPIPFMYLEHFQILFTFENEAIKPKLRDNFPHFYFQQNDKRYNII